MAGSAVSPPFNGLNRSATARGRSRLSKNAGNSSPSCILILSKKASGSMPTPRLYYAVPFKFRFVVRFSLEIVGGDALIAPAVHSCKFAENCCEYETFQCGTMWASSPTLHDDRHTEQPDKSEFKAIDFPACVWYYVDICGGDWICLQKNGRL